MIKRIFNFQFSIFNFKISGQEILKHPLFSGSFVMIIGSNFANFIAYMYHLIIGRMLGPSDYGVLVAVISLLGMVITAFSFLNLIVVRFVSVADDKERLSLFGWFNRMIFWLGIGFTIMFLIFSDVFSKFLHIDVVILIITAPALFLMVFIVFYRAFLQGILKFKDMVISINLEMAGRLLLGILAIVIGFKIIGVVVGIVLASGIAYLYLKHVLNGLISFKEYKFNKSKEIIVYALPVVITTLSIYSLFTTDVLLVKHFFASYDAGIYASVSTIAKVIFFATAPVASVMFPIISKRVENGHDYKKIFILSFLLTGVMASGIIFLYWVLPKLMVAILFGSQFAETATYLLPMGIFMGIFTLCSLMVNFYLSRNKTAAIYLTPIVSIIQIVGIWIYHTNLDQVIRVNIVSSATLLFGLLIYFAYETRKRV